MNPGSQSGVRASNWYLILDHDAVTPMLFLCALLAFIEHPLCTGRTWADPPKYPKRHMSCCSVDEESEIQRLEVKQPVLVSSTECA